jgi:hypothetical protein
MSDHVEDRMRCGWPPPRGLRIVGMVVAGVIGAAIFALAFGWFVMLLWNWLMPAIFGLAIIGYWQAFGIVILGKLIFGSIGGGGSHRGGRRHGPPGRGRGSWDSKEDWGGDRWRWWRDYWRDEGRDAFEKYAEKRAGGATGASEQKPAG